MSLVRWDPFRDLFELQRSALRDASSRNQAGDTFEANWSPSVDVFERESAWVVRAELPGVDRENIDIEIEDGCLVLSGERVRDHEMTEENTYRVEHSYGKFVRSFRLPKNVDREAIAANYKNGILEIQLPKAEEAKARKVSIEAA